MADRLTGKASYFTFNGIIIPITKVSAKVTRALANTTDNGDYYQQNDMIFPTQLPVSCPTEFAVEGRYRFSSTPAALIATLYTGVFGIPAIFGLNASAVWGHGTFDISDFETDDPVEDVVTFTCTMKSNGQFTPNS
jgi:hypothetical protein